MTNEQLKAWRTRLALGEAGMAAYLGTPVTTYRKWENGTRSQDASTHRLFDVLLRVEAAAPGIHAVLMSEAVAQSAAADKPKRKGRKPKEVSNAEKAAAGLPDWMKGGA